MTGRQVLPEHLSGVHLLTKLPEPGNMRLLHFTLILLTAFLLTAGFQCGDCEEVFCNDYIQFRFLSKTDDNDLYNNGIYKSDSLKVFALKADASVTDLTDRLRIEFIGGTNFFAFEVVSNATAYVFQHNFMERDTLRVFQTMTETDCCPIQTTFDFGIFYGDTVFVNARSTLVLKK